MNTMPLSPRLTALLMIAITTVLSGCAATGTSKADPFEPVNRVTFAVNDKLDAAIVTPIAKGYRAVTPAPVRAGVNNVFTNVGDVATAVNNLLQGNGGKAVSDVGRFLVNSTLGILGLFDVATPMGMEKNNEDFGQTLGKWGVESGPYLVLPLAGPTTLRDLAGRPVDRYLGYSQYSQHVPTRNAAFAIELIDLRSNFLSASSTLDEASLDKYLFLRDAFLQRRLRQVHDGKVPQAARDALEESLEAPIKTEPAEKK